MNTIPSEPVPDLLRIDEVEALDKASRAIDRYTSDLLVPATAFRTIHDGLLWRAVDRSWADYLRRRHKLTPSCTAARMLSGRRACHWSRVNMRSVRLVSEPAAPRHSM